LQTALFSHQIVEQLTAII